jgi:hypothetical protein
MPEPLGERNPDLAAFRLPEISWDKRGAGLNELYSWAEGGMQATIEWYLEEKKRKARWSRGLRMLAVILVTLGGAVPLAALTASRPALGNWGFVLIALAAGCVAYDRFSGYSSAWLRYMATATSLRAQLSEFQLKWSHWMAARGGEEPSAEDVLLMVGLIQSFVQGIHESIRSETQSWLAEFNANLSDLKSQVGSGQAFGG